MSTQVATPVPAPAPMPVDLPSAKFTASDYLTRAENAQAKALAADWLKSNLGVLELVHVGDKELQYLGTSARQLVDNVRLNEAGQIGQLVLEAVNQMRALQGKRPAPDPKFMASLAKGKSFVESLGEKIFGVRSIIQAYFDQSSTVGKHLDEIKARLLTPMSQMESGVSQMDTMLTENNRWVRQALIVTAALEFYQQGLSDQIKNAAKFWEGTEDRQAAVALLESKITLIDKKLGDLKPREFAAKNASREFIYVRDGDAVNAMGLNAFITTGVDAWTQQIAMIIQKYRQDQTAQALDVAHGFMQEVLVQGAQAVEESAVTAAKILQQQMIDVETLDRMTTSVINAGQTWLAGVKAASEKHAKTEAAIRADMDRLAAHDATVEAEAMQIAKRHTGA